MKQYRNYQEFIEELIVWGDQACGQQAEAYPRQSLFSLLQKAVQSADQGVFSPFLYIALSAHLEKEDILLLAAAFYIELNGNFLTPASWKLFLTQEGTDIPEAELFYQSAPLLYDRISDAGHMDTRLQIAPQIFLFLRGACPELPQIPGMSWYYDSGNHLPPLGKDIHLYRKIHACLLDVPGKKLVYLQGEKGSGRKLNYAYLAAMSQMSLAVISYEKLQSESQLREMQIACLLHHALFVIELPEHREDLAPLFHWLEQEETIFLLGTNPSFPDGIDFSRQYLPFSICSKQVLEDKELFEQLTRIYQWECDDIRTDFLNRYNFLPGRMHHILELAKAYALSLGTGAITREYLRRAILGVSSHSLDQYATKIQGLYRMHDLILPDAPRQQLAHIINRVRNRKLVYETWGFLEKSAYGNGTAVIFAGPPGTGKTMAAQVMAVELGMELYRIELPAVVDKYIGETEKKLNRIFDEAEKSMAILFFDEADVLFSKRTEVKESNDKYSNMEIAFLLQKMEEYDGVSILATNYLQNFDNAFRRRVSDIISFPMPDADMRLKMWQSMIPSKLPISDEIDFCFLAEQFELSGSMIKNTLIYASFLAAEAESPILTMELILKGLSHELEKSGKKLSRDEYGEYGYLF
ncbi:MAG: ATP-binding protein [Lachnospiraceae bacterium]|nr:ATP-binding protein [Lachnospiraceae bacterium]